MLKAVPWDMGGPIDKEVNCEHLIDEDMRRALTSDAGLSGVARWAVASFAPNAHKAMVWKPRLFRVGVAEQAYAHVAAGSDRRHALRAGMEFRKGQQRFAQARLVAFRGLA